MDDLKEAAEIGHYRVVRDGACHCGSETCTVGVLWTVVDGEGVDECAIGTSWGDENTARDICDLMNMAFDAGRERETERPEGVPEFVYLNKSGFDGWLSAIHREHVLYHDYRYRFDSIVKPNTPEKGGE